MRKVERVSFAIAMIAIIGLMLLGGTTSTAQKKQKQETFQAVAMGQSTQLGRMINVNVSINEYSTPEDQQILIAAFNDKGMKGLINALSKMKSKGRLSATGTLGYEVTYIRSFPTENGRRIRLITNRPLTFGEVWSDDRSQDYSLSALELIVSNQKGKSTGVLYPACQFKIDDNKELTIETFQNPWKLTNILDR